MQIFNKWLFKTDQGSCNQEVERDNDWTVDEGSSVYSSESASPVQKENHSKSRGERTSILSSSTQKILNNLPQNMVAEDNTRIYLEDSKHLAGSYLSTEILNCQVVPHIVM